MHLDQPRRQVLGNLPPGEHGTFTTLTLMRKLVKQFKRAPAIRGLALDLVRDVRPKDWIGEVRAVFHYVRDQIRYTKDVAGLETLQTPLVTLDDASGDCDDKSTLLASLLESVGHPTRFVAVGYSGPRSYSHVYVETRIGTRWVPLDATMPHDVGWEPRPPDARLTVHN